MVDLEYRTTDKHSHELMKQQLPGDWSPSAAGGATNVATRGSESISLAEMCHTGQFVAIYDDSSIAAKDKGEVVAKRPTKDEVIEEVVEMMEEGYFDS